MDSQPQNPEIRNNPENFNSCISFTDPQKWLHQMLLILKFLVTPPALKI